MVKGNQYIFPNQGVEVLKNRQKRSVKGDYIICGLGPRSCCKDNPSQCSVWRHDTIYKIIENSHHLEENWLKYSEITFLFISCWISPPKFVPVGYRSFILPNDRYWGIPGLQGSFSKNYPPSRIQITPNIAHPVAQVMDLLCSNDFAYTLET